MECFYLEEQTVYSPQLYDTVCRLVGQLTRRPVGVDADLLQNLIASENSHLLFLRQNSLVVGMATVGMYLSPTGRKAWIEDLVVDEAFRGKKVGRKLMEEVMAFVRKSAPVTLMLTSKPARVAANALYRSMGLEIKETNVYNQSVFLNK